MTKDLTRGKPFTSLLSFSLPVIGGNLFQLFYTLADSIIVGRTLGANALAAVGNTTTIVLLVLYFIQGFASGFGICLGHRCGAKDDRGMRRSIAVSTVLCIFFAIVITLACCLLAHPMLRWMSTPDSIFDMAYDYMFVVLLGSGATIFYNMISNILRALGDSRTPLIFLIFSSIMNIVLDVVFIVPLHGGVAGAAWATVLSQLVSAILCTITGIHHFSVMRLKKEDFSSLLPEAKEHLSIGFPMGFQMSVMSIGQLAMQAAVNALGAQAIAGYTAATKVDQVSVLINGAMGIAVSNFVAQNYGAGLYDRIRQGVRASLIQTQTLNVLMCAMILLCRNLVVPLFVDAPTPEIIGYSNGYLLVVAPFYLVLGFLQIYRSSIQSMGNGKAPFAACIIELIMRITGTFGLSMVLGYAGICFATPLAWIGAVALLVPTYYRMMRQMG